MSVNPQHAGAGSRARDVSRRPKPTLPAQAGPAIGRFPMSQAGQTQALGRADLSARAAIVSRMQQTQGNLHVQRFVSAAKKPVAVKVQRCGSTPCNCSAEERLANMPGASGEGVERLANFDYAGAIQRSAGGEPLHAAARGKLEPAMGLDLGHVVIHRNAEADALATGFNAEAFTSGDHIFFREGRYDPQSTSGLKLIAHEVAHTDQQAKGAVSGVQHSSGVQMSEPGDSHEQEAEHAADSAIARISRASEAPAAPSASRTSNLRTISRSASGSKVIQRAPTTDTAPGFTAKWTPFASVSGPPFQTTNFDTDGFHEEFNIPPQSSGRVIMLADVEWTKGGGTGPVPPVPPVPTDKSTLCKVLETVTIPLPGIHTIVVAACAQNLDPSDIIDSLTDAQICLLSAIVLPAIGAVACATAMLFGAGDAIRDAIKDILGIPKKKKGPGPGPGPNPTPQAQQTGKGRATFETRYFVGVDGKITTQGLPPRITANGSGAELVSPVDFVRSEIPGGVNLAFQPMLRGTTAGETNVFQHQFDVDLKQPAPPAPLPFSFGTRLFPFVTAKEFFEDEGTEQAKLLAWFQTMDPRIQSRVMSGQQPVGVAGHASQKGDPSFNLTLSEKRAKRVTQMVADFGGSFTSVQTFAFGELLAGGGPNDNSGFFRRADVGTCGTLEGADAAGGPLVEPAGNDPTVCAVISPRAPAPNTSAAPQANDFELE